MKILSSLQNNLAENYYRESQETKIQNRTEDDLDLMINTALQKKDQSEKILSNSEKNTLHMFFGTQIPDELKLYGQNNIKQINKGQLLDLRG
jgi:hypothetical protein